MSIVTIIIIIVAVIFVWGIGVFNQFVKLRVRAKEAWADIDVQLKRRYDLIPNLINTVKGYATHEAGVFEAVTKARTAAMTSEQSGSIEDTARKENMLSGTLKSLFAVSENYPELKANQNFLELQQELSDTENKIQSARRFYNGNVRDLNIKTQVFPGSIIAGMFNLKKMEFFELEENEEAREPVQVNF